MDSKCKQCPVCQNMSTYLGRLGTLEWFRCEGCGWEHEADVD